LSDQPRAQPTVKRFAPRHLAKNVDVEHMFSIKGHLTGVVFEQDEILASYRYAWPCFTVRFETLFQH
jgi:hypothetical protein